MEEIGQWIHFQDQFVTHLWRLAVALACGLALGIERERKDKPAGLRTILLISLGSALLMIISNLVTIAYTWPDLTRVDPSRIAAGVVTGIGFLGAGTIIQARGSVQGLTTAAVIWVASAIGLCAGMGYTKMAVIFTAIVLVALVAMDPLRHHLSRLGHRYEINIITPNDSLVLDRVRYILLSHDVDDDDIQVHAADQAELHVFFVYHGYGGAALRLLEALARVDGIHGTKVSTE